MFGFSDRRIHMDVILSRPRRVKNLVEGRTSPRSPSLPDPSLAAQGDIKNWHIRLANRHCSRGSRPGACSEKQRSYCKKERPA